ncbi:hypothetical protein LINPERHAP1_LOCUS32835 [Linum perenne]
MIAELPIHFFNHVAVKRIGDHIGRTVRLDLATKKEHRLDTLVSVWRWISLNPCWGSIWLMTKYCMLNMRASIISASLVVCTAPSENQTNDWGQGGAGS